MKSISNFIKEHKILTALIIMLIIFIIIFIILYNLLFVYNDDNRMNGKQDVEINETSRKSILNSIKEYEEVENASINIVTRQISFVIDVKKDLQKDKAKDVANKILEEFSDKEKEYYDIQVIAKCSKCDADDDTYPIIGYKNKTSEKFVWGNN